MWITIWLSFLQIWPYNAFVYIYLKVIKPATVKVHLLSVGKLFRFSTSRKAYMGLTSAQMSDNMLRIAELNAKLKPYQQQRTQDYLEWKGENLITPADQERCCIFLTCLFNIFSVCLSKKSITAIFYFPRLCNSIFSQDMDSQST